MRRPVRCTASRRYGTDRWPTLASANEHTKSAQKLGRLQPFEASRTPARMHGPTCILRSLLWANATQWGALCSPQEVAWPREFGLLSVVLHPGRVPTAVRRVAIASFRRHLLTPCVYFIRTITTRLMRMVNVLYAVPG
jgi:hypothetical protein